MASYCEFLYLHSPPFNKLTPKDTEKLCKNNGSKSGLSQANYDAWSSYTTNVVVADNKLYLPYSHPSAPPSSYHQESGTYAVENLLNSG